MTTNVQLFIEKAVTTNSHAVPFQPLILGVEVLKNRIGFILDRRRHPEKLHKEWIPCIDKILFGARKRLGRAGASRLKILYRDVEGIHSIDDAGIENDSSAIHPIHPLYLLKSNVYRTSQAVCAIEFSIFKRVFVEESHTVLRDVKLDDQVIESEQLRINTCKSLGPHFEHAELVRLSRVSPSSCADRTRAERCKPVGQISSLKALERNITSDQHQRGKNRSKQESCHASHKGIALGNQIPVPSIHVAPRGVPLKDGILA